MSISVYLVREYRFWGIRSRTSFLPICMAVVLPLPSMAAHLPCLPGSPPVSRRVPTSFVPPAHNQGVSLAPLQGRALWKKFLPTTGSFYVFADSGFHSPAPFGGRFLMSFPLSSLPLRSRSPACDRNRSSDRSAVRFRTQAVAALWTGGVSQAAAGLRMSPIIFDASYVAPV